MTPNKSSVASIVKNYKCTQNAFLSRTVRMVLNQEADVEYEPLVKPGDIVKEGEVIAKSKSSSAVVSYIHSSIPGEVTDISPCFSPNGRQDFSINIKCKGAFNYLGKKLKENDLNYIPSSTIVSTLQEKAVINTFKISKPENLAFQINKNPVIKNIIVRLFDEDSFRITDYLVSKFFSKEIIKAAQALAKAINATGIVFALDQKYEEKSLYSNTEISNFRLLEMNIKKYPCGTSREIISAFNRTGLRKTSNFEITKNDLYIDASTAYEVYKAVFCSIPSISKFILFSGNCINSSCLLDVKIGTPIKDIVNQLGGLVKEPARIIINGHICGTSVQSLETPVSKYVKSVEFISKQKLTDTQIYSCVNCGNCRFVCPVKVSPDILYNSTVNFKRLNETFAVSAIACIECGLCNTVCPARLPLAQTISYIKENLNKQDLT